MADAPFSRPLAAGQDAPARPLLTAALMAQLPALTLRGQALADGLFGGVHKSRRFGSSASFAEHKPYAPGDDLRRMDWKVFARKDRHYVKRYEEETTRSVHVLVDASASMAYRARGVSKFDHVQTLAAALCTLAHRQGDQVTLHVWSGESVLTHAVRGGAGELGRALTALSTVTPGGQVAMDHAAAALARVVRPGALVLALSDWLDQGDTPLAVLAPVRARGAGVVALSALHQDEVTFDFEGIVRFMHLEQDVHVQVDADAVRRGYLEALDAHLEHLDTDAAARGMRLVRCHTGEAPLLTLRALVTPRRRGRS